MIVENSKKEGDQPVAPTHGQRKIDRHSLFLVTKKSYDLTKIPINLSENVLAGVGATGWSPCLAKYCKSLI